MSGTTGWALRVLWGLVGSGVDSAVMQEIRRCPCASGPDFFSPF